MRWVTRRAGDEVVTRRAVDEVVTRRAVDEVVTRMGGGPVDEVGNEEGRG